MLERQGLKEQFKIDGLNVGIYETRNLMGQASGAAVAQIIRDFLGEQERVRIVFAAAPSQNEFLADLSTESGIDWGRVVAFHMDEYVGLAAESPQSFVRYLREHLWDQVKPGTVYALDGAAEDPEEECARYSILLKEAPIDVVCAGIGENGHLAFNDPPIADFEDPLMVKVVTLERSCRQQQVNDGCFPSLEVVPKQALSLTIPALMGARYIFTMVPGVTKQQAVRDTLLEPISTACPGTVLRRHNAAQLYLDVDSAAVYLRDRA